MNKKVRNHLLNIVFVLALLGLTVFILLKSNKELSWNDVRAFFGGCKHGYIVLAVCCMPVFLLAEAFSLKNIAAKFGYKTKFVSALRILRQTRIIPRLRLPPRAGSPLRHITW